MSSNNFSDVVLAQGRKFDTFDQNNPTFFQFWKFSSKSVYFTIYTFFTKNHTSKWHLK